MVVNSSQVDQHTSTTDKMKVITVPSLASFEEMQTAPIGDHGKIYLREQTKIWQYGAQNPSATRGMFWSTTDVSCSWRIGQALLSSCRFIANLVGSLRRSSVETQWSTGNLSFVRDRR